MAIRAFAEHVAPGTDLEVELCGDEFHYVARARRGRVGEVVQLFTAGGLWRGELVNIASKALTVRLLAPVETVGLPWRLELWLGAPDADALAQVLTQACELGVQKIQLLQLQRSNRYMSNKARMAQVLRAAMRQCGNASPPEITGPLALADALASRSELPSFFAWEDGDTRATRLAWPSLVGAIGARLCVGPEGGFAPDEAEALQAAGFQALGLGPYILRTPTAAVAGMARLMAALGSGA